MPEGGKTDVEGDEAMKEYIVQAYSQETIDSFDAHNAPELIRCKDCKWFEMSRYGERGFCKNVELIRRTTFYCADGERREEE